MTSLAAEAAALMLAEAGELALPGLAPLLESAKRRPPLVGSADVGGDARAQDGLVEARPR